MLAGRRRLQLRWAWRSSDQTVTRRLWFEYTAMINLARSRTVRPRAPFVSPDQRKISVARKRPRRTTPRRSSGFGSGPGERLIGRPREII